MNPIALIPSLVGLAVLYLLLPAFLFTFFRYAGRRRLHCPETGGDAQVRVAAGRAALGEFVGAARPRVAACSLWPARSSCGQRCLAPSAGPTR